MFIRALLDECLNSLRSNMCRGCSLILTTNHAVITNELKDFPTFVFQKVTGHEPVCGLNLFKESLSACSLSICLVIMHSSILLWNLPKLLTENPFCSNVVLALGFRQK